MLKLKMGGFPLLPSWYGEVQLLSLFLLWGHSQENLDFIQHCSEYIKSFNIWHNWTPETKGTHYWDWKLARTNKWYDWFSPCS